MENLDFLSDHGSNTADGGLKDEFQSQVTNKIEDTIICKLVRHPNFKTETGENRFHIAVRYWPFKIGNDASDIRYRPCNESLGKGQSKEYEFYKGLYKQLDELRDQGKQDSEDAKIIEAKIKRMKPKYHYYYLYITPDNPMVKALKAPVSVHNQIAGRSGNQYREEIPSVFQQAIKNGMNIALTKDPEKNKTGWLKIWKTGQKMATRYHAAIDSSKETRDYGGTKAEVTVINEHNVPNIESIAKGKWPDIFEYEEKFAWTEEECQAWIDSDFTKTPDRVMREIEERTKNSQKNNENNQDDLNVGNLDDIPF